MFTPDDRSQAEPEMSRQQLFHSANPSICCPTCGKRRSPQDQNKPTTFPSMISILTAEGTLGSPGMVMISPQINDDKLGTCRQAHLSYIDYVYSRAPPAVADRWRTSMAFLRDAHRIVTVSVLLKLLDLPRTLESAVTSPAR